jgi:GT2 family glycosyltransferase
MMRNTVPIAVIIPTYNRGSAVISVVEKIQSCDPKPAETWVHIDLADGALERVLYERFPEVKVLTSSTRLGCGGGRHRGLLACSTPYAATFDDDSYPVDSDFFSRLERLFLEYPKAAVLAANIWHRKESEKIQTKSVIRTASYIGCGHAVRLAAYRQIRGLLPRTIGYGMEESDISLQLFAAGWHILLAEELRVFHDTDLMHREAPEITSGTITNIGLYAFLNYPVIAWGWGLAQVANIVADSLRRRRFRGICSGLLRIPGDCYRNRRYRQPVSWRTLRQYRHFRRTGVA